MAVIGAPLFEGAQAQDVQKLSDNSRGMSIQAPRGWYVAGPDVTKALAREGLERMESDEAQRKAYEASVKRSGFIFSVHRHAPGTPNQPNVSVVVLEENIAASPGIKDGCDYNTHVQKGLARMPGLTFTKKACTRATIGGKEFGTFEVEQRVGDQRVLQIYGSARISNNAVSFVQTYQDNATKSETSRIVNSLSFAK